MKYFLLSYNFFLICFFNDIIHDFIEIGQIDIPWNARCAYNVQYNVR